MNTGRVGLLLIITFLLTAVYGQEAKMVEAKGTGTSREDALQDALRYAIEQAAGVTLSSETQVENYMVVRDAISTNTKGYISSYEVVKETPFPDRYEVVVKAQVSMTPLMADIELLTRQIGGVRFLVMYDKRHIPTEKKELYENVVDRINGFLAEKQYRYIEKNRFKTLQEEAFKIMKDTDTGTMTFVQKLGILSGAQFIIFVDDIYTKEKSESFGTRASNQVVIEAKTYDNCTAEGLGTVALESDWVTATDKSGGTRTAIDQAVDKSMPNLLNVFNTYIGNWVNNGIPYELRFYQVGTFRDFRELRNKIRENRNFGGQFEITSVNDYTRLNLTFRRLPDELAFDILDFADAIPNFREKVLDVLMIYGRQISFAPQDIVIPEIEETKKISNDNQ